MEIQARAQGWKTGGRPHHPGADLHAEEIRDFCYSRGRNGPSPAGAIHPEVVNMAHGVKANALQRLRGLCVSGTALVLLASPAFAGDQNQTSSASAQTSTA